MGKKTEITIDLTLISGASILPSGGILNEEQYNELFGHVSKILGKIEEFTESLDQRTQKIAHYRVHDVITVHGKRGTGKTSFLLSSLGLLKDKKQLKDYLDNIQDKDKEQLNEYFNNIQDDVCVLDIMDPTLFACREHLLHALLSQIKKKISEHFNYKEVLDFSANSEIDNWLQSLQLLSIGLKAIGEVREDLINAGNKGMQWEDPEYLMQYDMEAIQHSMELEQAFHKVIRGALKILGKKAFVLALDDTDTRPAIGWHVLEVLRRYFTTPQLIVIISGDFDLFATIIRQKHVDSLKIQEGYNSTPKEAVKKMVTGLTEQYLLKILRPNLRIRLGNFHVSVLEQSGKNMAQAMQNIKVKKEEGKNEITLEKLLDTFFNDIGCHHGVEQRLFRRTLLNNPVRTVVQVLDALYDRKTNTKEPKRAAKKFAFRLCEIFFTQIRDFGFSPFKLQEELKTLHGITRLTEKLILNNHVALGMGMLPHYEKSDNNEALLCLYINLLHAVSDEPSIAIVYMFKACLLREILNKKFNSFDEIDFPYLQYYLCLEIEEPLYKTVKRMTGLLWRELDNIKRVSKYGTVYLTKESDVNKHRYDYAIEITKNIWQKDYKTEEIFCEIIEKRCGSDVSLLGSQFIHTLNSLRARISSWHKNFIMPAAVSINKYDANYNFFSVISIISLMGDLLMCKEEDDVKLLLKKSKGRDSFSIYKLDGYDYYEDKTTEQTSYEDSEDIIYAQGTGNIDDVSRVLFAWISKVDKITSTNLLPTLCSRSMERFFNAIRSIKNEFPGTSFLGTYMHRCLVIFLNSILVEEFYLSNNVHEENMHVTLQNPINDDFLFIANLINSGLFNADQDENDKKFINIRSDNFDFNLYIKKYPVFYFIFTCPLWGMFLNKNEKIELSREELHISIYDLYMPIMAKIYKTKENTSLDAKKFYEISFIPKNDSVSGDETDPVVLSNLYPALNLVAVSNKTSVVEQNDIFSQDVYDFIYDEIVSDDIKTFASKNDNVTSDFKSLVDVALEKMYTSKMFLETASSSDVFYEKIFLMAKNNSK